MLCRDSTVNIYVLKSYTSTMLRTKQFGQINPSMGSSKTVYILLRDLNQETCAGAFGAHEFVRVWDRPDKF